MLNKAVYLKLSLSMSNHLPPVDDLKQAVTDLLEIKPNLLTKKQIDEALALEGGRRVAMKYILRKLKRSKHPETVIDREIMPFLKQSKRKPRSVHFKGLAFVPQHKIPTSRIGLFLNRQGHGVLVPCHRKDPSPKLRIDLENFPNVPHNHVVVYRLKADNQIHIEKVLGNMNDPKTYSLMAIYSHNIPHVFADEALNLAKKAKVPPLGKRTDFRDLPLVTIDGEDARDFDDAVWATADTDPRNQGGWRAIVAIADVAHYVQDTDDLDHAAHERGNSVYFADRVVPMLPEALSNELCSLRPDEDRACLAVEMVIGIDGKVKSHRFKRGLMRSKARLTYNQVQNAIKSEFDKVTKPLWEEVLQPLYGVYQSLLKARHKRGTLDLDVPERQIIFDEQGRITGVKTRERHESHQLIEELMIAANVCAARTLLAKKMPTLFRVHDQPETTRVENLKTVLKSLKIQIPKAKTPTPSDFQSILALVQGSPYRQLINDLVLRSQAQACYSPKNIGHFGLSLADYCHFTSPIRRYADLIVHRGLIASLSLGEEGHEYLPDTLENIGTHISVTERTAAIAEREVTDRLMTAFLEAHIGKTFEGTIVGVTGVGIFISLNDSGAQGFIPKSRLGGEDYYVYDVDQHQYRGQRTKKIYQLGQAVAVRLEAADPVTCSTTFSLYDERAPRKGGKKLIRNKVIKGSKVKRGRKKKE